MNVNYGRSGFVAPYRFFYEFFSLLRDAGILRFACGRPGERRCDDNLLRQIVRHIDILRFYNNFSTIISLLISRWIFIVLERCRMCQERFA